MNSQSKVKKAKEKLEATMREAKRTKLGRETYPFFNLSAVRANISLVTKEKMEEIRKEDVVGRKGKTIMGRLVKEAEEIQMEISDYFRDESVSSEFYLHQKH